MEQLLRLEAAAIRWLRIVALIGFFALVVGACIVTADGLLRAFVGKPIRGLAEIVDISTAIVIATCFPVGLAQRRNIRITLLNDAVGPFANKILDVFSDVVLLAFVTVVSVQLIGFAIEAGRLGESSLIHQIPAAPFWMTASTIMSLSIPAQMLMTLISIARLFSSKPNPASPDRA